MSVIKEYQRPKTIPQLKREQKRGKRKLDIIAGFFGGGCAILSLWIFIVVFLK